MSVGVIKERYEPDEEYLFHAMNDVGRISIGDVVVVGTCSAAKINDIVLCVDMKLRHYKGREKILGTVKRQYIEY